MEREYTFEQIKTSINNKTGYVHISLHTLVFDDSEDVNKIYNIQYINHMMVKIEAIRNSELISKCNKMTELWSHTENHQHVVL